MFYKINIGYANVKGIDHPKMKILSSFAAQAHFVPNLYEFIFYFC